MLPGFGLTTCPATRLFLDSLDPDRMDCLQHGLVITRVLVGVSQREPRHGLIETADSAQLAADERRVSGLGVGACECPAATRAV